MSTNQQVKRGYTTSNDLYEGGSENFAEKETSRCGPNMTHCCCCIPLKTGLTLIGVFNIFKFIGSVMLATGVSFMLYAHEYLKDKKEAIDRERE